MGRVVCAKQGRPAAGRLSQAGLPTALTLRQQGVGPRTRAPTSPPGRLLPLLLCSVIVCIWLIVLLVLPHRLCGVSRATWVKRRRRANATRGAGDGCGGAAAAAAASPGAPAAHLCRGAGPWGPPPRPPPLLAPPAAAPPPRLLAPAAGRLVWLRLCVGGPWRGGWPSRGAGRGGAIARCRQGSAAGLGRGLIGRGSLPGHAGNAGSLHQAAVQIKHDTASDGASGLPCPPHVHSLLSATGKQLHAPQRPSCKRPFGTCAADSSTADRDLCSQQDGGAGPSPRLPLGQQRGGQ